MVRAKELESDEALSRANRPKHVAEMTKATGPAHQRNLVDIDYEDIECLELLGTGSTLAGDIERWNNLNETLRDGMNTS